MYQNFYGLRRRPFSATPDPDCYVPAAAMETSLAEIRSTVVAGQGIAVLTAPAGLGKTLACLRLIANLGDSFACVWLPTANYCTRRSLLQAILYELGRPYAQMAEQELRLQLISAARAQASRERAVVIVVDEAHLLSPRLLEELRGLTNVAASGRGLIRVVLCGQLALEETLAGPELAALNQRIDCQATLVPLSMQESREYLAARLKWAGGDASALLAGDAVDLICRASDGSPRCLNQLADHSLILGAQHGDRPVSAATVRLALDELKQLPLVWTDAPALAERHDMSDDAGESSSSIIEFGSNDAEHSPSAFGMRTASQTAAAVIEVGGENIAAPARAAAASAGIGVVAPFHRAVPDVARATLASARPAGKPAAAAGFAAGGMLEEPVIDRYAMLDAGLVPPDRVTISGSLRNQSRPVGSSHADLVFDDREACASGADPEDIAAGLPAAAESIDSEFCESRIERTVAEIQTMLDTAAPARTGFEAVSEIIGSAAPRTGEFTAGVDLETGVGTLVLDTCRTIGSEPGLAVADTGSRPGAASVAAERQPPLAMASRMASEYDIVEPEDTASGSAQTLPTVPIGGRDRIDREDGPDGIRPPRHYAQLFSELRRRQRQRS